MSIKIVDEVEIRLTAAQADRLYGEYQQAMQYYAGPYKSFETWLREKGYGKQLASSTTEVQRD